VIRVRDEFRDRLHPDFLAALLRSPLTLAQTRHMTTGNTHPRLSNEDVRKLAIPVPDLAVQERTVGELRQRRVRARRLREEAAREWAEARAAFEARLVGNVPVPAEAP
jgi:restriction endonuclease S subunit